MYILLHLFLVFAAPTINMQFSLPFLALLIPSVLGHPGPHIPIAGAELQRRSNLSRNCAAAAASLNAKRYAKRNAERKRSLEARSNTTYQITTEAPYYEVIQNDTCVLTPEVTAGPYIWPRSQTLRQDMSEGQAGVELILDIGVLDMATCEPLPNVLLDLWHCNATGSYSSFTALSPNTGFVTLLQSLNISESNFEIGVTDLHTDDTTFLRGMWPTDANGVMEMKTIFPGFYIERSIHIHAQVHTDWTVHSNGKASIPRILNIDQNLF